MIKSLLAATGIGALLVPALAVLTALSVGVSTSACLATSAGGALADDAPVPAAARAWVAATKTACPDLPEPWIAAVMAQESGFRPGAYADDANGGTWGLFQLNASVWAGAYGHPWSADLDHNGTWDVADPDIHARVAGNYLCARLAGVRQIRTTHPDWASAALPELDALIIAHNAGETRLRTYPALPRVTARFITAVNTRVAAWSTDTTSGAQPEPLHASPATPPVSPGPGTEPVSPAAPVGCVPALGSSAGGVTVPAETPHDVATAVTTGLSYVGVRSGWRQMCDRLACRAYGYATSGYTSAKAHWARMTATGHARPGDRCPPLGSFVFWQTGRPFGHVSLVVRGDPGCDPAKIMVTANEVFDAATGNHGGVYLLSLARLDAMYLAGRGYLGWSDPLCQGQRLPAGTTHPAPSGR